MKRFVFVVSLLAGLSLLLAACGPKGTAPNASGNITLIQEDDEGGMRFNPETIMLTAGQKVTITLENQGEKDHEFMIGKEVIYNNGAPDGFKEDFFSDWSDQVEVNPGMGAMLMIDGKVVQMGGDMGMSGDNMEMDHMGWMVMDPADSKPSTVTFTVPEDRVGEWEMGCFEDDGAHYDDGMKGKIIVVKQ